MEAPTARTTAAPPVSAARAARGPRVWRGVLVGAVLLPLNALWVTYLEGMTGHGPYVSTISLFLNVVCLLVMLALLNSLAGRLRPRLALSRGELVLVCVMLTISTSVAGLDMVQVLISVMTVGSWQATPQNRWGDLLPATTPSWLGVSDREVLYAFYNGTSTLYQRPVLEAWLPPVLWWGGFTVVLVFVMVCLSVLLRPLWADRERLTFPMIQLPLELTDPGTTIFRSRLLWVGFALAGGVDLVNGLNALYPALPAFTISTDLMTYIHGRPWEGIGWLPLTFYPSLIGMCFLMPLDLLFSCVAFFFWWKLLYVLAAAMGVSQGYSGGISESIFPYANEQMFGGYVAIACGSLLLGRRYFRHVWLRLRGRPSEVDDAHEGLRFRAAAVGALTGMALLVAFSIHAAMSPGLAAAFFLTYYLLAITVARVRAEFGSPVHDFHFTGPDYTLSYLLGTANLRGQDLGVLTQFFWFNRAYRGHPIADSLEGLQMANRAQASARGVVAVIVLSSALAFLAAFWLRLHLSYQHGAATVFAGGDWYGKETYGRLQSWVENPKEANPAAGAAMAVGFGITLLLMAARTAFAGWPLHPVAFALSASWSIHWAWTPMLLAWLAKLAITRYGGLQLYRQALPFFYGLILGEAIVGCGWPLAGLVFGFRAYSFLS